MRFKEPIGFRIAGSPVGDKFDRARVASVRDAVSQMNLLARLIRQRLVFAHPRFQKRRTEATNWMSCACCTNSSPRTRTLRATCPVSARATRSTGTSRSSPAISRNGARTAAWSGATPRCSTHLHGRGSDGQRHARTRIAGGADPQRSRKAICRVGAPHRDSLAAEDAITSPARLPPRVHLPWSAREQCHACLGTRVRAASALPSEARPKGRRHATPRCMLP
jgi:hypothetical protein